MAKSAKVLRTKRGGSKRRLFKSSAVGWLAGIAALVWGWSVLDAPIGPGEPVTGMVVAVQLSAHNESSIQIEMPDGSTVMHRGHDAVGSHVQCLRFAKKYLPGASYECE